MPWAGLDDDFFHNRKSRAVGKDGRELFVASICYCNKQLNDGCFVAEDVPVIAALAQVEQSVADRLYQNGMWHPEGFDCAKCRAVGQVMPVPSGHITVHEFLVTNRSRQQVIADRQRARNAALARHARSNAPSTAKRSADRIALPVPVPDSDLSSRHPGDSRGTSPPVDNPDDDEIPAETWKHYAQLMLDRQPPGTVSKPTPWKRTTASNAQVEHTDTALRWWRDFDVDPRQLAAWLIDGKPSPYAKRRPPTTTEDP